MHADCPICLGLDRRRAYDWLRLDGPDEVRISHARAWIVGDLERVIAALGPGEDVRLSYGRLLQDPSFALRRSETNALSAHRQLPPVRRDTGPTLWPTEVLVPPTMDPREVIDAIVDHLSGCAGLLGDLGRVVAWAGPRGLLPVCGTPFFGGWAEDELPEEPPSQEPAPPKETDRLPEEWDAPLLPEGDAGRSRLVRGLFLGGGASETWDYTLATPGLRVDMDLSSDDWEARYDDDEFEIDDWVDRWDSWSDDWDWQARAEATVEEHRQRWNATHAAIREIAGLDAPRHARCGLRLEIQWCQPMGVDGTLRVRELVSDTVVLDTEFADVEQLLALTASDDLLDDFARWEPEFVAESVLLALREDGFLDEIGERPWRGRLHAHGIAYGQGRRFGDDDDSCYLDAFAWSDPDLTPREVLAITGRAAALIVLAGRGLIVTWSPLDPEVDAVPSEAYAARLLESVRWADPAIDIASYPYQE